MISRRPHVLLIALVVFGVLASPALAAAPPLLADAEAAPASDPGWTIIGGGWGHGVGMSQFGAYGMALEGHSAAEILHHYYSGAELDDLAERNLPGWWSDPYPVLVGIVQDASSVSVGAMAGSVTLCQMPAGAGGCATTRIPSGLTWTVARSGDTCVIRNQSKDPVSTGRCEIDVTWDNRADSSSLPPRVKVGEFEYARGSMQVTPAHTGLNVVLEVPLEEYLLGMAEMPTSWPSAALEAQVIAARNYAIRKVLLNSGPGGDARLGCDCQLYPSTVHQVFRGWSAESVDTGGWGRAVRTTGGVVATHPPSGRGVFDTYYSSSTGGRTSSNEHVWNGEPLEFLRSVDDHWATKPEVSNWAARWEVTHTGAEMAELMGWDRVDGVSLVAGPPHSVVRVQGVEDGSAITVELAGDRLRWALDLHSGYVVDIVGAEATSPVPEGLGDIADSVHAADIEFIAEAGITKGCNPPDNTRYCPTDLVTRGQMAAFLGRTLGLGGEPANTFVDDQGSVFEVDIARLADAGITKGCNPPANDEFCPDRFVTRGEMAAFLVRAFGYTSPEASADPATADETASEDPPLVAPEFLDSERSVFAADITALASVGVTRGCNPPENDRFCPDDRVTREQMASFLARAIRLSEE